MKTENDITRFIMRRVYAIYYFRKAMQPQVRLTAFLAILLLVTSSVSMPNIIANALHASNFAAYLLASLATTHLYIQLGVLAAGIIFLSALADLLRSRETNSYA